MTDSFQFIKIPHFISEYIGHNKIDDFAPTYRGGSFRKRPKSDDLGSPWSLNYTYITTLSYLDYPSDS